MEKKISAKNGHAPPTLPGSDPGQDKVFQGTNMWRYSSVQCTLHILLMEGEVAHLSCDNSPSYMCNFLWNPILIS
jgi:hypothetical protein